MIDKFCTSPDRYKILKDFARENRNNMTLAERFLWEHLRKKQLGHRFLRQYPILDYIVDFICRDDGLIIEVDGSYHSECQQQELDELRQQTIEAHGYHFLRFSNEDILYNINAVIQQIQEYFK